MAEDREQEAERNKEQAAQTAYCDCCGRPVAVARLSWLGGEDGWLCPDCRAERESCGCSD